MSNIAKAHLSHTSVSSRSTNCTTNTFHIYTSLNGATTTQYCINSSHSNKRKLKVRCNFHHLNSALFKSHDKYSPAPGKNGKRDTRTSSSMFREISEG